MELVLKCKGAQDDRDPLLVFIEDQEKGSKEVRKINLGETVTVSDEVGYSLLAKYKGMFVQKTISSEGYATKTVKAKE